MTQVVAMATDAAGNAATCEFFVTVTAKSSDGCHARSEGRRFELRLQQ
jgi:hypothetical protein